MRPAVRRVARSALLPAALVATATTCESPAGPASGAAAKLAFVAQPVSVAAAAAFDPVVRVEVRDAAGHVVTTSDASVRLRLTGGSGTPHAHLRGATVAAASGGVARFPTLNIDSAGARYTLTATADGLDSATSGIFTITVGPAARLAFAAPPADVTADTPLDSAVRVVILDAAGNLVRADTRAIAISFGANPGLARLGGATTRAPVGGVARFGDLRILGTGAGYSLTASAVGLASATTAPFPVTQHATAVSVGYGSACAVVQSGAAYCWGDNAYGTLGDGSTTASLTPVRVTGGFTYTNVSVGYDHACGGQPGTGTYCWGLGADGRLGNGTTANAAVPTPVAGTAGYPAVTAGGTHTCALTASGAAYCWGHDDYGQLGTGSYLSGGIAVPALVAGLHRFADISAGYDHTCAVDTGGAGWCWGDGYEGQLGDGTDNDSDTPVAVAGNLRFVTVSAGENHTCGVTTIGPAYCWGVSYYGEIGASTGGYGYAGTPVAVSGGRAFTGIAAGAYRTCAIDRAGAAYCWGTGPVGDGTSASRSVPTAVAGGHAFASIGVANSACAVTTGGALYCWGAYADGGYQFVPVRVLLY